MTPNPTMVKFGYPATRVAETAHWCVLLRPEQPTLGSLVLAAKSDARAFADLSPDGFADLKVAVVGIERMLKRFVAFERINYLMLMMVDPDVHCHVIPRYEGERAHDGVSFPDRGWPGPPALGEAVALDDGAVASVRDRLAALWDAASP